MSLVAQSLLGLLAFPALAWLISEDRGAVRLRPVIAALTLQLLLAWMFFYVPALHRVLDFVNRAVLALQAATEAGTTFAFGYLGGGTLPFEETQAGSSFILVFRALPLVLVISALTSLLVYWRILPLVVRLLSFGLERTIGIGGAAGLSTAANVFVGMVEAPLFIRPYLPRLTRSELFVVMVGGMASIAGTVLVLYASVLGSVVPGAAGHMLVASLISMPAAVAIALLMVPETGKTTPGDYVADQAAHSAMEAITLGARSGVELFVHVTAMLIVLVALVHLGNEVLGLLPEVDAQPLTFERILGWAMAPFCWLMGVPWKEAQAAGALMGVKTVLNELLAYLQMVALPPDTLSPRSLLIMTYALCGFANIGSLGILIGGLVTMVPERREEVVALGFKSLVGGTLATSLTAATVGLIQP